MRILLTGASSFTGSWFARELTAAGHDVTATFRGKPEDYSDPVRRARVDLVTGCARAVHGVRFGDEGFLALVREGGWDLLAHHAAEVSGYRDPDFDVLGAVAANTRALQAVLEELVRGGCRRVLLTGSVFEGGEGAGSDGLPHLSPYGLSKSITASVFQFRCRRAGMFLGKFVIPNPFGPHEDPRYTAHLVRSWIGGKRPVCMSPLYVRDNIPVSLLAREYVRYASGLPAGAGFSVLRPSGYVESQGAFTARMARELEPRLGVACPFELANQQEFPEPRIRINTDPVNAEALGWQDAAAWDEMARWYLRTAAS